MLVVDAPYLVEPLKRLADAVVAAGCQTVGLKLRWTDVEYPIWVMLRNRGFRGPIWNVRVDNESARLERPAGMPDALVTTDEELPRRVRDQYPHAFYFYRLALMTRRDPGGWRPPGEGVVRWTNWGVIREDYVPVGRHETAAGRGIDRSDTEGTRPPG